MAWLVLLDVDVSGQVENRSANPSMDPSPAVSDLHRLYNSNRSLRFSALLGVSVRQDAPRPLAHHRHDEGGSWAVVSASIQGIQDRKHGDGKA